MAPQKPHSSARETWELAREQHGVVTRRQLLALGFGSEAIRHRIKTGRLHPIAPGLYAVGRRQLGTLGRRMAAVLSCGPAAVLSHESAGAHFGICVDDAKPHISVPRTADPRRPQVNVHRRRLEPEHMTVKDGIPVTSAVCTLVDLATRLSRGKLEAAVNEADKRDLIDPDALRAALGEFAGWAGVAILRGVLDRDAFAITDSELERRFLRLVREVVLPRPVTGAGVCGFRVDFFWPDLGLVVETDGLRYHRTPAQQARDRHRDQVLTAAGLTILRFTHAQVAREPERVKATLLAVGARLRSGAAPDRL